MNRVVVKGSRQRQHISREAARLMAEEGVIDHQSAKHKAVERLGLPAKTELPDNLSIESALVEYLNIFEYDKLGARRSCWINIALQAMQLLSAFNPQLVGAVLRGTVTRFSRVQILVETSPEQISIFLNDHEIPFDQSQRRVRLASREYTYLPMFLFNVDDVTVEIDCTGDSSLSRKIVCPVTGKNISKAGLQQVMKLAG
jgi:hypothetical protein